MENKLPKVFANKIDHSVETNKRVAYSKSDEVVEEKKERSSPIIEGRNIYQKINSIFNSTRYVYKADVIITTKSGKITKKIIGKNANHLITINNELIPIDTIIDIDFA